MQNSLTTPANIHGRAGNHLLQLPGPTNIPPRVLQAMAQGAIDQRSPEWASLAQKVMHGLARICKTSNGEIFPFPSSGTGAGEAAIANTLSPGDRVLVFDTGWFSSLWIKMCQQYQLGVEVYQNDWRRGPDASAVEAILRADTSQSIKAVLVVQNETSTGVETNISEIRQAMDAANHGALLIVDTISSLGSYDFRFDDWRVDVAIGGSQKGLMLPPGFSFNAVSAKAREASKSATLPKFFFDWQWMRDAGCADGIFPYTPPIQHFYGLQESLSMLLDEEGLDKVFLRHAQLGTATRAAVAGWGLETVCQSPNEYSDSVTAVMMPPEHDADAFRQILKDEYQLTVGGGLARFAGKSFRIGHMGSINKLMMLGVINAIEIGLAQAGVNLTGSGSAAAQASLLGGSLSFDEQAA